MSAQNIRIMKEARALFWPWVAIMLVAVSGAFATLRFNYGTPMLLAAGGIAGFYLGAPLLAALSFGNEFQYRTVSVLLAQPVARLQLWREKLAVMLVAVSTVSLAYFLTWRLNFEQDIVQWVFSIAFLIAAIASSTFWVLIARSTVGGVVLNIAVQLLIVGTWAMPAQIAAARRHIVADAFPFLITGLVVTLGYSGVMLWLGRRKLARFQVTGEVAGQDFLSGRRLVPEFVVRSLRWQPSGATLNLIKKEWRLLRPVWLLAALTIAFFVCLMPLRSLATPSLGIYVSEAGVAGAGMYLLLGGILAGSLSMGEERQLGTHSWHLTLPISAGGQWLLKLFSSMLLSLLFGFLVWRSADLFLGPAFQKAFNELVGARDLSFFLSSILMLTFSAFCCACAVNGTVRAAVWTVPALMVFSVAVNLGPFIARLGAPRRMMQPLVLAVHAYPGSELGVRLSGTIERWFIPIVAAFAVFQSYRLFRVERPDSMRAALRPLMQVCLVGLLYTLVNGLGWDFVTEIGRQEFIVMLGEVGRAVDKLEIDPATLDAAHPQPISLEDLSSVYPLSNVARTWLRNASISVAPPLKLGGGLYWLSRNGWGGQGPKPKLSANIRLSNGWNCQAYGEGGNCKAPGAQHPPLWPNFQ